MTAPAPQSNATESLCVFGAREGYTPQIGIFVSQLNWMRKALLVRLQDLSPDDLDWLPHPEANSIGALLLHLAATDVYYRLNTCDSLPWGHFPDEERMKWGLAMALGETARSRIKGHDLSFYLAQLAETRDKTLLAFQKWDDEWLMSVDETWFWGPTNNLCKWFHVCEHESHHLGQIDLILKQLPSRKDRDKRSMHRGQASGTALGVALRRASHQIYDASPLVFEDPVAVALLGDTYAKALADTRASLHQKSSSAMRAWVLARSRFAEEQLERAVGTGVRQYVVLGAGLDTFGLRNPYPEVKVFEVDHPSTQVWKRKLVASSKLPVPASLHYVAVDFETQNLREQLKQAGLDLEAPALFAMLGVVVYLTAEAFQETLNFVASFPRSSGVIFDYALPRHMLPADEIDARDELAARVASIGEPFRLFFGPEEMRSALGRFDVVADLDDKELNRRYFNDRSDQLNLHGRSGHIVSALIGSSLSSENGSSSLR